MTFAFIYKFATCLLVMFYSFNVIDSNKHIFMTFIYNRTYSESFTFHGQIFSRLKDVTPTIRYTWFITILVIENSVKGFQL